MTTPAAGASSKPGKIRYEGLILIRAVALTKRYDSGENSVLVFDNLELEVPDGERLALVGESGAGKSTLLHLLGGLDRPTAGAIYASAMAAGDWEVVVTALTTSQEPAHFRDVRRREDCATR